MRLGKATCLEKCSTLGLEVTAHAHSKTADEAGSPSLCVEPHPALHKLAQDRDQSLKALGIDLPCAHIKGVTHY